MLSDNPARQVVLVDDPKGRRVVRRISAEGSEGPDLVDRAIALGLVRQVRIPGFALVEERAIAGSTLEVTEAFVEGVTLAQAIEEIRAEISVSVAISLVFDLARGLELLHSIIEPSGRPAHLVHGRIGLDQVMLTPAGEILLIGLEGRRGEASRDVRDLLALLHTLLVAKASSKAGSALLARLAQLRFDSAEQMTAALSAYLRKQSEEEVLAKRAQFAALLAQRVKPTVLPDEPPVHIPETPTDQSLEGGAAGGLPFPRASGAPTLGLSDAVSMDPEEVDNPTITNGTVTSDPERTIDSGDTATNDAPGVDHAARQGLLAPAAAPPKVEVKWGGPERSVTIGDYRVVASIGRGGMGEIYLARSESVHYRGLVALKVLGLDDSGDDEALGMFIDEAAIMAQIDHPNVLKVVDFGRARGRHFLAMEYLEGRPLVRVMIDAYQRESGLDYGAIAAIGADAARGLFAAHEATAPDGTPLRVVHRDVSPQNIFVTYPGITKVIDFGVARATQRVSKTAVGVVKGKAAYMSPEQTEGKEVDARSDVFSLGICLWEMTAGRRLFKRETEYETLLAVATAPIEKPTLVRGKPSPVLDRIILSALHRNRDKRTPTARDLATQLAEYAAGVGVTDGPAAVSELMHRLFGAVAAEEKALIQQLELRVATEAEVDSLRRLSGVSPRKGVKQEVTLVGAPSGLLELDHFGIKVDKAKLESKSPPVPASAGAIVLRAVEAIKAEQAQAILQPKEREGSKERAEQAARTEERLRPDSKEKVREPSRAAPPAAPPEPPRPVSLVAPMPKSSRGASIAVHAESPPPPSEAWAALEPGLVARGASMRASPAASAEAMLAIDATPSTPIAAEEVSAVTPSPALELAVPNGEEHEEASPPDELDLSAFDAQDETEAGESPGFDEGEGAPTFEAIPSFVPAPTREEDATAKRPAFRAGSWLAPGSSGRRILAIAGVVVLLVVLGTLAFVLGSRGPDEPTKVAAVVPPIDAGLASKPAARDANGAPEEPALPVRVKTTTASVEELIDDVGLSGLVVTPSEGSFLVTDKAQGSVVIDRQATVTAVDGGPVQGFLVQTTRRGLPRVVWIGAVGKGPWTVRALSVNDCAASVRVEKDGLAIAYGDRKVNVPHGGATLHDVALERPDFAERLEIEPLHLSFGKKDVSSTVVACSIGWWGHQVVLRSLPEGRYALRWIGGQKRESAELVLGADDVTGGRFVREKTSE